MSSYWSLGGRFTIKADGRATDDRLSAAEALFTKLAEPPLHIHHREDEAWYVLEGHLTFTCGDRRQEAGPGDFVFAPRGIPHTFTVDVEPTRALVLSTSAGFADFIAEAGVPEGDSPGPLPTDLAKVGALLERFDLEILGPPPGH